MSSKSKFDEIYETLLLKFPNAKCELDYSNMYELICAVVLSAQTTDKRVNEVTKVLFAKYKNPFELAKAEMRDVYTIVSPLGLGETKAKNIISLAKALVDKYDGKVPSTMEELTLLPGVGRKTASVVLVEGYKIPAVPVDTHVFRVCHRLGISDGGTPLKVEMDIKNNFKEEELCKLHILLIYFGRYICKAKNPDCDECPLAEYCQK